MKKMKIDLHGMRHLEAKEFTQKMIDRLLNTNVEVTIVTGRSEKMINIVVGVLEEYNLEPRVDEWLFPGCVRVDC